MQVGGARCPAGSRHRQRHAAAHPCSLALALRRHIQALLLPHHAQRVVLVRAGGARGAVAAQEALADGGPRRQVDVKVWAGGGGAPALRGWRGRARGRQMGSSVRISPLQEHEAESWSGGGSGSPCSLLIQTKHGTQQPGAAAHLEEVGADGHELRLALVLQRAQRACRAAAVQPVWAHGALGAVVPAERAAAPVVSIKSGSKSYPGRDCCHEMAPPTATLLTCMGSPCPVARTCRCGNTTGSTQS